MKRTSPRPARGGGQSPFIGGSWPGLLERLCVRRSVFWGPPMSVLTCPSCRGSLTADSSAVPYVVTCPHCRQPLTVPALDAEEGPEPTVEDSPFATPSEDRPRSRYRRANAGSS